MSPQDQTIIGGDPEFKYVAWVVDDDIRDFELRLRPALKSEHIDLVTFQEPQKCLDAVGSSARQPHILISDLQFDISPVPPRNMVGAFLPWRVNGRVKEAGWHTQTTLLTNFLDRYLGDLRRVYTTKGFAPQLICSKSFVSEADGLRTYARALRLLCEQKPLSSLAATMKELPSYVLEPPRPSNTTLHKKHRRTSATLLYLLLLYWTTAFQGMLLRPSAALSGFLGGILLYTWVWTSAWGLLVGTLGGAALCAIAAARKHRALGSVNIQRTP